MAKIARHIRWRSRVQSLAMTTIDALKLKRRSRLGLTRFSTGISQANRHLPIVWRSLTMNQPQLSLEQQFNLRSFETQVEKMSREQAQECLLKLYEQMIVREATYQNLLKHQWGLEPPAA